SAGRGGNRPPLRSSGAGSVQRGRSHEALRRGDEPSGTDGACAAHGTHRGRGLHRNAQYHALRWSDRRGGTTQTLRQEPAGKSGGVRSAGRWHRGIGARGSLQGGELMAKGRVLVVDDEIYIL